jgi:hypothetical protein
LLGLLKGTFVREGRLIVGLDETLERRYGKWISARGIYRDPVRSTHEEFVKSSGLSWVCMMLLVEVLWISRVWALPFLSALAPSERYAKERGRRHKKITEWAWKMQQGSSHKKRRARILRVTEIPCQGRSDTVRW